MSQATSWPWQCSAPTQLRSVRLARARGAGSPSPDPLLASGFGDRWRQNGMWTPNRRSGCIRPPAFGGSPVRKERWRACSATNRRRRPGIPPTVHGDRRIQRQRRSFRRRPSKALKRSSFRRVHVVRVIGHFHGEYRFQIPASSNWRAMSSRRSPSPATVTAAGSIAATETRRPNHRAPSRRSSAAAFRRPGRRRASWPVCSRAVELVRAVDHLHRLLEGEQQRPDGPRSHWRCGRLRHLDLSRIARTARPTRF